VQARHRRREGTPKPLQSRSTQGHLRVNSKVQRPTSNFRRHRQVVVIVERFRTVHTHARANEPHQPTNKQTSKQTNNRTSKVTKQATQQASNASSASSASSASKCGVLLLLHVHQKVTASPSSFKGSETKIKICLPLPHPNEHSLTHSLT